MKKRFILTNAAYIITTITDLGITYCISPDLLMENNIFIRYLGYGWRVLILLALFSIIAFILLSYYSCFRYKTVYSNSEKFTGYYSDVCYDRADKFWRGGIPKHLAPELAAFGFALPWGISCFRFICICEWCTIYTGTENLFPYSILREKYFAYIPTVIITITLYYLWFYTEFKKQRRS